MEHTEKITLRNMVFTCSVGTAEWEREVSTHIEVDLEVHADLEKACRTDDVNDTIDYTEIYGLASKIVGARHYNLLESLAGELADGVIGLCGAGEVVVRIRKPHPPVGGPCACAEIEISRHNLGRR